MMQRDGKTCGNYCKWIEIFPGGTMVIGNGLVRQFSIFASKTIEGGTDGRL
jgi:hypothetical protein